MMERNQEKALVRFGIDPENLIRKDGRYWMTAEQLGRALGYKDPKQSIANLYQRNKEELKPYKGITKLITPGGPQDTIIFNTDGQWLLCIFAKTAKAAKLRKFVISMLKAIERKELVHVSKVDDAKIQGRKEGYVINSVLSRHGLDMPVLARYCHLRRSGLTQPEISRIFGLTRHQIHEIEAKLRDIGVHFTPVSFRNRDRIALDEFNQSILAAGKEVQP